MGGCRVPGPTCSDAVEARGGNQTRGGSAPPRPTGTNTSQSAPGGGVISGWPRAIAWSEFREISKRPDGVLEDAQIHSEVSSPSRLSVTRENGQFRLPNYPAKLDVVPDDTWVVTGTKSDALLAHEQVHFDITGLSGRDMVREMLALRAPTTDELQRAVTRITERYQQLASELTKKYDDETNHGRNADQQKRWAAHIKDCVDNDKRLSAPP